MHEGIRIRSEITTRMHVSILVMTYDAKTLYNVHYYIIAAWLHACACIYVYYCMSILCILYSVSAAVCMHMCCLHVLFTCMHVCVGACYDNTVKMKSCLRQVLIATTIQHRNNKCLMVNFVYIYNTCIILQILVSAYVQ